MKRKSTSTKRTKTAVTRRVKDTAAPQRKRRKKKFPGYPLYPQDEDIYNTDKKIENIDLDDGKKVKQELPKPDEKNEKGPGEILTGDDLDVPGAELDDELEELGEEDEENNYYSLGGDEHDDEE